MSIWAIVPVKPLRLGKSRLSGVLTENQRTMLNRICLQQTLETLQNSPEVSQTMVISRDPAALAVAREFGVRTVMEDGMPNLNGALARATTLARAFATHGVLILPADLPLITKEDISELLSRAHDPPVVVIAPDRRQDGTNALVISPGGLIRYNFGKGSFTRHCAQARNVGARLEIVQNEHLALDIDLPEDLALIEKMDKFKILKEDVSN